MSERDSVMVGRAVVRREDPALLTGRGQYVDDVDLPGTLHAFVVRSPVAHARIVSVDVSGALAADGIAAVLTAADLDAAGGGPTPRRGGEPGAGLNPPCAGLRSGQEGWGGEPTT